jgi:tRNA threonylcarbamoyladenosine biosynthesis protein TsaB
MSVILNIDTAQETAFVCISENGKPKFSAENHSQKDHASFLHLAIDEILKKGAISIKELDAIAVTKGPGSYTGLRVGMSAAKGIAYTIQKPLITISSLELMAHDILMATGDKKSLICPMIDARRMEVFTAMYDSNLNESIAPSALILDDNSFADALINNSVYFAGSGSLKFQQICKHKNANFIQINNLKISLSTMSKIMFDFNLFNDIASVEPDYLKAYKAF